MYTKHVFFSLAFITMIIYLLIVFIYRSGDSDTIYLESLKLNFTETLNTEVINTNKNGDSCPNGTILYTVDGGNTGNKVWEYLSVLAVYKLFPEKRFFPYIPDSILKHLEKIFEPLSLPPMSQLPNKCQKFEEAKIINNYDRYPVIEELPSDTKAVQICIWASRPEDVIRYGLDKVRQELRYKPALVKIAMGTLSGLKKKFAIPSNVDPVYVGIHFRGTDYTSYLRRNNKKTFKNPPNYKFYSNAMRYFTEKYKHVIFILISVDYKWIGENVNKLKGNIVVNPYEDQDKAKDMALLSHCNHSIINYGTFGVTVAMLAGGTTIVYNLKAPPTISTQFPKFVDNWIPMN